MTPELGSCGWPLTRLGEALQALGRASGLSDGTPPQDGLPRPPETTDTLEPWLEAASAALGFEVECLMAPHADAARFLAASGPGLVRLETTPGQSSILVVLRSSRRTLTVLDQAGQRQRLSLASVRVALCAALEARQSGDIDRLLDAAAVPRGRRRRARETLLRERLGGHHVGGLYSARPRIGSSFGALLRRQGIVGRLAKLVGAHALVYLLWGLSWTLVGRAALGGAVDAGWMAAWALLLVSILPLRLVTLWLQGLVAIDGAALLRGRLLAGALKLDPDSIRHQGSGQLLGRVLESEAVESMALRGGFLALVALLELTFAVFVLALGAGGVPHALSLTGWLVLSGLLVWCYAGRYRRWTEQRFGLTHDLVERMAGHRTRLAQERHESWHAGEVEQLGRYLELTEEMDRTGVALQAAVPRGWLLLGLLGLAPVMLVGEASPVALAVGVGGCLLAMLALTRLMGGLAALLGARFAWEHVSEIFEAAARSEPPGVVAAHDSGPSEASDKLIEARGLGFRHASSAEPQLGRVDLRIAHGDRLLLQGSSGSGKSTLAGLLGGTLEPSSGLLLLGGLDQMSLGYAGWRRRVAVAPQFHHNRVFMGSFAFNLLMGKRWPPRAEDLREAEELCIELGLGDLLERMPAGLEQMVGECGWQLSHGERSRLYLARALLQGAELVVLDECFGALDPENLRRALGAALRRAPTLMVIAHP